jgi:hypothetical protein
MLSGFSHFIGGTGHLKKAVYRNCKKLAIRCRSTANFRNQLQLFCNYPNMGFSTLHYPKQIEKALRMSDHVSSLF